MHLLDWPLWQQILRALDGMKFQSTMRLVTVKINRHRSNGDVGHDQREDHHLPKTGFQQSPV